MNELKRSSINIFSSTLGYFIPMVINLISTPLLLKYLGETAYGIQSLVAVIIGYLTFMDMGLDLPIIKYLAEDRAKQDVIAENHLLNSTMQLYFYIGLAGMISIILLSDWLAISVFKVPDEYTDQAILTFKLAGIGFLGSVGMSWGRALAMGMQRFDISYSVSIIINTAGTLSGLFLVYIGYGVVEYVFARMITTALAGPAYFLLIRRLIPHFKFNKGIDISTFRRIREYLGYGTLNRIISSLVSRLDQTLIGIWVGVEAAGIYAIPFLVISSLGYMLAFMLGFIFPMASELQSLNQMDRLKDIFIRSSQFVAALGGAIFIPLLILGNSFFTLWTPTIAVQVKGVFYLLCISGYIGVLTTILPNNITIGLGKIRQFTIYATSRSIVLATFCTVFIHFWGLKGAGWALLITSIVDVIWFVVVITENLNLRIGTFLFSAYYKPFVLTILLGMISLLLKPFAATWVGLILIAICIGMFTLLMGFIMGVFGDTEKRALKEIIFLIKK